MGWSSHLKLVGLTPGIFSHHKKIPVDQLQPFAGLKQKSGSYQGAGRHHVPAPLFQGNPFPKMDLWPTKEPPHGLLAHGGPFVAVGPPPPANSA